ncbi:MAG TPA: hypothetical protein V6D27_01100 [Vampirovibrionales bacterium]
MTVNRPSKEERQYETQTGAGHIEWQGEYEIFEREGQIMKAHRTNCIMPDGYRTGRWESTLAAWSRR